jgi:hypothetical protein
MVDHVVIPAQQIKAKRRMTEVVAANNGNIESVEQRLYMALDESGARVKAEVATRGAARPGPFHVFGARHPVMFWLTDPDGPEGSLPFAVIATTSEAWLAPDADISFADSAFTD